jgi:flagellar motor switch protein FliM
MAVSESNTVTALDFSQPTKFTAEIRHRIAAALEPFCEGLATYLTSELKGEVRIAIAGIAQHTWAAAKSRLPADSIAVAVEEEAIERHMLLSVEQPLMLQALECLLGGEAAGAPAERHLSEVDWVLARGLLDGLVGELSSAWAELGGPVLARGAVDLEGDAGVLTPVDEPTLAISLESSIDGAGSGLSLLIPWAAVAPIAAGIRASARPRAHGGAGGEALRRGVAGAQVLLRAEVGSVQMPVKGMLELVPGGLLALGERAEDGVLLYAEGVSIGRGRPGRSGTRRAIKLQAGSAAPVRADTYATLGRAELERARAHAADAGERAGILESIFVRVWAELGRTHMPLGQALELAAGAVVELDQDAQAPIELFANGLCFASGSLVVTGAGGWGVQLERLL